MRVSETDTRTEFVCRDCKKTKPVLRNGGTGYATYTDSEGVERERCYACCGVADMRQMREVGKITLYLQSEDGKPPILTNWPGSLTFTAYNVRRFRHPFARMAYLGEFVGPDEKLWRFKNIGDSQLAHCQVAGGQS